MSLSCKSVLCVPTLSTVQFRTPVFPHIHLIASTPHRTAAFVFFWVSFHCFSFHCFSFHCFYVCTDAVPVRVGWLTGLRATWTSRWALWSAPSPTPRKLQSFSKKLGVWVSVVETKPQLGFPKANQTFWLTSELPNMWKGKKTCSQFWPDASDGKLVMKP